MFSSSQCPNYYHDNKDRYLETLALVRALDHVLTPFLEFALRGVQAQTARLANALGTALRKELFRNLLNELSVRLENVRNRAIVKRQLTLLSYLPDFREEEVQWFELKAGLKTHYEHLKDPGAAMLRDIGRLVGLEAIQVRQSEQRPGPLRSDFHARVDLDWPSTLTETEFFERLHLLPRSKPYRFPARRT